MHDIPARSNDNAVAVSTLTQTISHSPMQDYFCYYCETHKLYCAYCNVAPSRLYYSQVSACDLARMPLALVIISLRGAVLRGLLRRGTLLHH